MDSKFKMLESKLNIASELIEELEIDTCDIIVPDNSDITTNLPTIHSGETPNEVFSIDTLKTDFMLIRSNVMSYISSGKRILNAIEVIDVADIKPALVKSISELLQALGSNAKLMVDIYKQIADIEKTRNSVKQPSNGESPSVTNQGTIVNNNIVFQGGTDELLDIIRQNKIS